MGSIRRLESSEHRSVGMLPDSIRSPAVRLISDRSCDENLSIVYIEARSDLIQRALD